MIARYHIRFVIKLSSYDQMMIQRCGSRGSNQLDFV